MLGYIYIITNLINDKVYIGKRQKSKFDFKYWGSGLIIKESIKKYGIENFSRDVLCWCDSLEELNNMEKYYIKEYDSKNPLLGYNLTDGGDGVIGHKWSEETRIKFHNSMLGHKGWNKGIKLSEEQKKNMYGHIPWNKGKKMKEELRLKMIGRHLSEETKQKISKANKGKKRTELFKLNVSKFHKGKKRSKETIEKIKKNHSHYWLGKKRGNKNEINKKEL